MIKIAVLFNPKAKKMILGRKNWREKLKLKIEKDKSYIWIHCASLGEFEQGRPLIEKIKENNPQTNIVLTFFSSSGYEIRKNYQFVDIVCYLPFDTKSNARDFVSIVNPEFVVFVKYEIWHHFLKYLYSKKIPVYLISGIFRKNQIFFKWYGKFYKQALGFFTHLFLQDENSSNLLENYGINNTDICGDTRIDRVNAIANEEYSSVILSEFSKDNNVIVCGSTWDKDETIICRLINEFHNKFKLIIAPHEVTEKHLQRIEKQLLVKYVRFSAAQSIDDEVSVIIVDSIGILSKLYRFGKVAYIGGGFGKGIHNVLEAVVYNIPVVFGPNYKKFKEANDLIADESAYKIDGYENFQYIINMLFDNDLKYVEIKKQTEEYIKKSLGATVQIFEKIQKSGKN